MAKWRVFKLVKENGKAPFDKWYDDLSAKDQAKVDEAIDALEGVTQIPPEKLKKYNELYELKIFGQNKALRPLVIKDGSGMLIILLVGITKKGRIKPHEYEAALALAKAYQDGNYRTKGYWEN